MPVVAATGVGSAAWHYAGAVDELLSAWCDVTPALVVNRLAAMATNGSKPYQLERIREAGLSVPETLITTDPDAAREFWEKHGAVVYKSISGVRSRVSRLGPEHASRFADVASCPTQFQTYVPGHDYRVHVVGDRVFTSEIACAADDYRYPDVNPIEMRAHTLPQEIEDRCLRITRNLELVLTGIDLRRTPDGEWYCFEVNPSPAFTYFEHGTGQPIGRAIAELLAGTTRRPLESALAAGQLM
jgi:glutathione synthase/RimK-type ligase-like ATP-grasp enzyme